MSLRHGRPQVAIPGPSIIPDRVLAAMQRPMPNIYEGPLVDVSNGIFADLPKVARTEGEVFVVIGNGQREVLLRQIAGAMAKRIVSYFDEGDAVEQGADIGFIKFGSRVDLFLPLDARLEVEVGDKVKGNVTVVARL